MDEKELQAVDFITSESFNYLQSHLNTLNGSDASRKTSWLVHFSNITDAHGENLHRVTVTEHGEIKIIKKNVTCNDMYSIVYKPYSLYTITSLFWQASD